MRFISLWNADHQSLQTINTKVLEPSTTVFNANEITPTNLLTASALSTNYWQWYVMNTLGRNWLRILCNINNTATVNYFTLCPALNASAFSELRAQGAKRLYYGLRVYAITVKAGANLITVAGNGYYPITSGNVYFVEAVFNLETNTRTVYVNGTVVNISIVNDLIAVGNYNTSIFTASGQSFGVTDYYFAASEPSDAVLPARLGKIIVGTALPVTTSNDSKFTVVGGTKSIAETLAMPRDSNGAVGWREYVESDSNGSKMDVRFAVPVQGNNLVGAALRVAGMKGPTAQVTPYADTGSGPRVLNVSLSNVGNQPQYYMPVPVNKPTNGWSEDELNKLTVKLWSERAV